MRQYKIMEWNINQATNKCGNNIIPEFVGKEIIKQNADVVILTEFCFCSNVEEFLTLVFDKNQYDYFPKEPSQNTINKQNEVLIAWKKAAFSLGGTPFCLKSSFDNNVPNFTSVTLKNENNVFFTIAGARITMALEIKHDTDYEKQAELRKKQMEQIYNKLKGKNKVIVAGDFNNYRRGTSLSWNINQLTCDQKEYIRHTPLGQSINAEVAFKKNYEFAEDHFITKKINMISTMYDRNFTQDNKSIYIYGKNFSVYDKESRKDIWSIKFGCGVPNHAILIGYFTLYN